MLSNEGGDARTGFVDFGFAPLWSEGCMDFVETFHPALCMDARINQIKGSMGGIERTVKVSGLLVGESKRPTAHGLVPTRGGYDRILKRRSSFRRLPCCEQETALCRAELSFTEPA
ncbi:hypothetical protein EEJ42_39845 [Streptomyces botrytidirepellens]|uniref:Uncharacterized protein n=1 Tax=Streptomyces botrytidirepellens TaxID=2486417 RepID=A0A3M8TNR6_9ACTN|nr:hypothetical protein EEJ42_39845 [Streptomyces botrytidirepellens]